MITEGSEHGTIEEDEKEIIERVISPERPKYHFFDDPPDRYGLGRLTVYRTRSTDEFSEIIYSTYPACEGSIDNVKGLVYVKDMLKASRKRGWNRS